MSLFLLRNGAEVDIKNSKGETPPIGFKNLSVMKTLLVYGAKVNSLNILQESASHHTAELLGSNKISKLIIKEIRNVNQGNICSENAIHLIPSND